MGDVALDIGFVGLGAMGRAIAANLVRAPLPVTVFDVRAEPLAGLVGIGASSAAYLRINLSPARPPLPGRLEFACRSAAADTRDPGSAALLPVFSTFGKVVYWTFDSSAPVGREGRAQLSRDLASFIATFDGADLQPEVLAKAVTGVIDGLAVIVAGASDETAEMVHRMLQRGGQLGGAATVLGTALKGGMLDAAVCNGVAAHAHDYDDVLQGHTTHPTTHLLPPLLAISETRQVTGREFLTAYIVGLEVELGLAMAMGRSHYNAGFHSTGTLGALGAAAAAARLLGLDAETTLNAIAIASSSASGLRVNSGSPVKPLHAGHAARTGLEAAFLAADGFHGSPDALYGRFGYVQAYQGTLPDGPRRWETEDACLGKAVDWLSFKPYPCCGEATAAVEAAIELRQSIPAEEVGRIAVTVCPLGREVLPFDLPQTPDQARFSAPYCVGVALQQGDLKLDDFTHDAIRRQDIMDLIALTTVSVDPDLEDPGAVVEVWAMDGRNMARKVIIPTGNRKRGMPREVERAKFTQCTSGIFTPAEALEYFARIEGLDGIEDVGPLVRGLVPGGK